ncbi:DNA topoisomerase I [Candidatus Haloredivivus sp. G17]|jgi:DNA topoisomerase-1|nr:DNA topoisomerase I [Candidatus Haloredivivus sp. G17]
MATTVMVGEKPKVASRLAQALGDYSIEENRGVKNYVLEKNGETIIIAPAVGHIFNLNDKSDSWDYPVFDVEWVPTFETDDSADYMKKYYNNLKDQLSKADEYINACDYDLEGSVIGANVIKHLTDASDDRIKRMKFSTLTASDLEEAYDDLESFDEGMTEAGLTRHVLDFYYGINVSRALMKAVRSNDRYKTLSTGRVQGPALAMLAEKERSIMEFEPDPYWEIFLRNSEFDAKLEYDGEDRLWDEETAEQIFQTVEGEDETIVSDVDTRNYKHKVPVPFNLTDLQSEASSQFNINPKQTQAIAQTLYENGLISYPRTESQKLPAKIGYKNLLKKIKNQENYTELAKKVLDKDEVYPKQGKKEDDAHPAIYPTGEQPGNLSKKERKVYDLIVKRFLAVFGKAAERQSITMTLETLGYEFKAKSKITLERNWFDLYDPYVRVEEAELPELEEGQRLDVEEFEKVEKETKPPRRYSQSGIVSELEKRNLGTKATRAQIVDRLYNRDYIEGDPIEVTKLGLSIVNVLEKYCSEVVSENLTRDFEEKMENIREGENTRPEVLNKAENNLGEVLRDFKEKQKEIGAELVETIDAERNRKRKLGPCDKCEDEGREDGILQIIKTNGSRFVGCTNYPDCENTYPLPNNGTINSSDKECETCGKPMIFVERKNNKDYSMCIDPDCASKDDW